MPDRKSLEPGAYGGVDGEAYCPYVTHERTVAEMTWRAILVGALLGVVFGAANAYIGLQVGMTVSASIPVAVIAIALGRFYRKQPTVLENNMVQTVGSAGESLAAGVVFTVPAMILLGVVPELSKVFVLAAVGGLLGVLFMVPLRRHLMVREHGKLPFPEGTACAEVLVAGDAGGSKARMVMGGLGLAGFYQLCVKGLEIWPYRPEWRVRGVEGARISVEVAPALLGVGYVIGPKIAGIMLAGGALGWLVLIPVIKMIGQGLAEPIFPATTLISEMDPIDIWDNYIRYIGAGAVALGGLVTLIKAVPTMVRSFGQAFREIARGLRIRRPGRSDDVTAARGARVGAAAGATSEPSPDDEEGVGPCRTSRDMPMGLVLVGAVVLVVAIKFAPQIPVGGIGALLIALFSFFFVTVSSRIVGLLGSSSNPASGMTIATLLATSLVFLGLGWTGPAGMVAAVSVGAVVCVSICIAGDVSQDLKTGFLVGATPVKQQLGEIVGVLTSAIVIGWTVFFLHRTYGIGSDELPAPQAVLMSMVVRGVLTMSLPWTLVFIGAFIAACVEILGIPSLPFAVGLYLPVRLSTPIMIGGIVRYLGSRTTDPDTRLAGRERGVLMSSGLIAGGAIVGLIVAGLDSRGFQERISLGSEWAGTWGGAIALGTFIVLAVILAAGVGLIKMPRRSQ